MHGQENIKKTRNHEIWQVDAAYVTKTERHIHKQRRFGTARIQSSVINLYEQRGRSGDLPPNSFQYFVLFLASEKCNIVCSRFTTSEQFEYTFVSCLATHPYGGVTNIV
jgi:hypothetical protein